jgi:hypothetical protein
MPRARTWIAGIVMLSLAGCSLVSGWSDLQEGGGGSADAGRDSGTGSTDSSSSTDTSVKTDANVEDDGAIGELPTVRCGGKTCQTGLGCCVVAGSGASCSDQNDCTGTYFGCVDRRNCTRFLGAGFVCCLDSVQPRTSDCDFGACPAGNVELCDPSAALPCSNGRCTLDLGNGIKACQ